MLFMTEAFLVVLPALATADSAGILMSNRGRGVFINLLELGLLAQGFDSSYGGIHLVVRLMQAKCSRLKDGE